MMIGEDAEDGQPRTMTAREYLDQAEAEYKAAIEDAKLYDVAGACLLGVE